MNERVTREERGELKRFFPGTRDTLLLSALEGYTGRAFENSAKSAALVVSRGFVFLGGKAQVDDQYDDDLQDDCYSDKHEALDAILHLGIGLECRAIVHESSSLAACGQA